MRILARALALLILVATVDCSLYQSEGRKFLEKQAYDYAGAAAVPNQLECAYLANDSGWSLDLTNSTPETLTYRHPSRPLDLRLTTSSVDSTRPFSCDYRFESLDEMNLKFEDARALLKVRFQESLVN